MRLKRDHTSWKAEGLFRKLKPTPDEPKAHAKKDTKRWCLGKPGRLHDYYLVKSSLYVWGKRTRWLDFKCIACGKGLIQFLKEKEHVSK